MKRESILNKAQELFLHIENLDVQNKIEIINELKILLHNISPLKNEPVDCVLWVKSNLVNANDYNPNRVAPPEMELLKVSIENDGYTQPIVAFPENFGYTVVDGFHRNRVGKEFSEISARLYNYLPIVKINDDRKDKSDRIASTIRHNRARGKHIVDAMSEIVLELKNRNWKNERIAKELGMDMEEILRLCQITGLQELFQDDDFSKSWNVEDAEVDDFEGFIDEVSEQEKEHYLFHTLNTNDKDRIFHTYDKWECYKAGFYKTTPPEGMTKEQCLLEYKKLLTDELEFRAILEKIIIEWKYSCEHYLTNKAMNRIAWLGQAALCYAKGISAEFRGGFNLLTKEEQNKANVIALEYLNKWLLNNGYAEVTMDEAADPERQVEIY